MPEAHSDLGAGLWQMLCKAAETLEPSLADARRTLMQVIAIVVLVSVFSILSEKMELPGILLGISAVSSILLQNSGSLLSLGADCISQMSEYGKLFLPVITAALASQGAVSTSGALYVGTAFFDALLGYVLHSLFLPAVYLYLAVCISWGVLDVGFLKAIRDAIRKAIAWCLKTLITVFLSYMTLTGVLTGSVDAAAVKAAKTAISTVVPVIGSTLANASDSILIGAEIIKNGLGLSGIFAVFAIVIHPFLQIGLQYAMLKVTALFCELFSVKKLSELVSDFSSAFGLLLGMVGTECVLQIVSTVCFLKCGT